MTLNEWVNEREIRGKVTFTADDAYEALPDADNGNIQVELSRLISRGRIQNVYRGFYVIMPPQYALKGIIPAPYYIDALMKHIGKPYYVALLSAASLHGATHQRAMATQVMTRTPRSTISERNKQISWCFRKNIPSELLLTTNTEMGIMYFSCAELTAVDLVQFASHIGGYQRAATVLSEMMDVVDIKKIELVLPYTNHAVIQRLGYILENVLYEQDKADVLYSIVERDKRRWHLTRMSNEHPAVESQSNRWRINMNIDIEIDEI